MQCFFLYHAQRLAVITENPGEDGKSYILVFEPQVPQTPLQPFELPFNVCKGMVENNVICFCSLSLVS